MLTAVVKVGKEAFKMELINNATSRSLLEQLPLSIEFSDFGGLEKIFYPPNKLSKDGAPAGAKPTKGDVMCYSPWGNIAIFYKDASYASGLIPMGKIENVDSFHKSLIKGEKAIITSNEE